MWVTIGIVFSLFSGTREGDGVAIDIHCYSRGIGQLSCPLVPGAWESTTIECRSDTRWEIDEFLASRDIEIINKLLR